MSTDTDSQAGLERPADHDGSLGLETRRIRAAIETRVFGAATFPARVGRFTVIERVGEGAMGTVWAAFDPELDRRVAIKVLHRYPGHSHAIARMRREAMALARLDHPNVVAVHEVGAIDDHLYIAMEFARGTLATWARAHPPGAPGRFAAVLELAIQAARGLVAAHAAGLVHRDIKPSNVLVDDGGRLRIADFGLARVESDAASDDAPSAPATHSGGDEPLDALTRPGEMVGTPAYMAPEQIDGRADARSDQFGLAVTLWEIAFGVRPFDGATLLERAQAIANDRPRVPAVRGDTPQWFAAVLRRGMAAEPDARWPDAAALLRALERGRDRKRRRSLALVGIGLATAIAVALGIRHVELVRRCGDAEARLAPAWTAERRAALAPAVAIELDEFAAQWSARYDETCRTLAADRMITRDSPLPSTASPRVHCLADARDELATIVDAAVDASPAAAPALLAALPSLVDCDEREVIARSEHELGSSHASSVLARARALSAIGRVDEAEAALDELAADSTASAWTASHVEEQRATIDLQRARPELAAAHADAALGFAEQTRDRELAVRAWLRLFDAARVAGHDERAAFFAERAESLSGQVPSTSLREAARAARRDVGP